jgi:hypothetical protein
MDELGHKRTSDNALSSQLTIASANNRFTASQGSILYDNAGNNNRRQLFSSPNYYQKFLTILAKQD